MKIKQEGVTGCHTLLFLIKSESYEREEPFSYHLEEIKDFKNYALLNNGSARIR